jgi:hypothetical protein
MRGTFGLAENLSASQEGLCSMEYVSKLSWQAIFLPAEKD